MPSPIIELKNAQVYRRNTRVFDNLNLTLHEGENVAIVGPNGAGKTTLLKLLSREISPVVRDGSHIRLFGQAHTDLWELRSKIGVVSHEEQSRYEAIATGLEVVVSGFFGSVGIHGHQRVTDEHIALAEAAMQRLNISYLRDRQYLMLSTGQQRRLLLARALVHQPRVLVLDEPTAGLDLPGAFQLLKDMQSLCDRGLTLILVTHHIDEIIPQTQRLILLRDGQIFADGTKRDLLTSESLSRLYDTPIALQEINGFYRAFPADTDSA